MARIGGAFPLPTGQVQEGTNKIQLGSGGVWYFPAGEYVVLTDAYSVIERWDPIETIWIQFIPVSSGGFISVDGYNFRIHNLAGAVTSNTYTAGSGMTNGIGATATGVSVAYAASNTTGYPTATGYVIIGGSVGGIYPFIAPNVDAILRAELPNEFQMPKIELSQFGAEGPALGGALLLHQRMFSVDERAFYPDGGARGLFRMASV